MKNKIKTKSVVFGVRVSAKLDTKLRKNFALASRVAELTLGAVKGTIMEDVLRYYYGSNDKDLMKRRQLFLDNAAMIAKFKDQQNLKEAAETTGQSSAKRTSQEQEGRPQPGTNA